jgi:hypothetical protein
MISLGGLGEALPDDRVGVVEGVMRPILALENSELMFLASGDSCDCGDLGNRGDDGARCAV